MRADERIRRLVREEIAPGFESLIRASVEVICDLMATLELPRVDGVYDSPLGSVCYHVDDLAFSEFVVAEDGLRVANQTGENADSAGFGSTVSIEGIRTVMNDIRFAYCEFPKNWGVVDSEGLCTVKVDGAKVGISYDIIVNTPELMRLVNRGVELSKNEEKIAELKEKVKAKFANARGEGPGAEGANEGSRRASIDSFHSADEGERRSAGAGAGADASPATKTSPATSQEFSSPASKKKKKKKKTPNHAAADAASTAPLAAASSAAAAKVGMARRREARRRMARRREATRRDRRGNQRRRTLRRRRPVPVGVWVSTRSTRSARARRRTRRSRRVPRRR